MGVTTVALIDTDSDPDTVDLPIPGNDDSIRSIELMLAKLADAVPRRPGRPAAGAAGDDQAAAAAPPPRSRPPRAAAAGRRADEPGRRRRQSSNRVISCRVVERSAQ